MYAVLAGDFRIGMLIGFLMSVIRFIVNNVYSGCSQDLRPVTSQENL